MKEKYDIRFYQDNQYQIYNKDTYENALFTGTIEEVNAWLSLQEKGFTI